MRIAVADLATDFWSGWVATITIVTLIALGWLVASVYFPRGAEHEVPDQVWDETLREGSTAAPLWWFWLLVALLAITVVYLMLYPGLGSYRGALRWSQGGRIAASAERYEQEFGAARAAIAATDLASLRANAAALGSGESVFKNHCAACHGEDARGQALLFPDLTDASWQWGGDTQQLDQTIALGRKAVMPPWQAVIGDDGVAQVADYVLSLSGAGGRSPGGTDASDASEGVQLYQTYCSACHGISGAGLAALGAPALNDDVWLYGGSVDAVRASIALGRTGEMPAFGGRLDAAQLKLLAAWLTSDPPSSADQRAR
jgi:cytochrome c oxidase cbb3-type subunit III